MNTRPEVRFPPRDWLDAPPELDTPTYEDVELQMDILSGASVAAHRFGDDDWSDGTED